MRRRRQILQIRLKKTNMSAYAHQMEREFSAQNLSSRGNSDISSSHRIESGFYMTSFAATIFIGALVAAGVLFITLVIALTVMWQSCESKNAGIVEFKRISDDQKNFCTMFSLHAQLNHLEMDAYPQVCRDVGFIYVRAGQYERDLNISTEIAAGCLRNSAPSSDGLDLILMDIDDLPSPHGNLYFSRIEHNNYVKEAERLKRIYLKKLYIKLEDSGWPLVLVSRKLEVERDAKVELLTSAGFKGWFSLIMRSDNETRMSNRDYFSRRRQELQNGGFRIMGTISSQIDALTGSCIGKHAFKIPSDPIQMHHKLGTPATSILNDRGETREE